MFSRSNHPYIQIDDSFLNSTHNADYDPSYQGHDDAFPLHDLSRSGSHKRHTYKALDTPGATYEGPSSFLISPSTPKSGRPRATSDVSKPLPNVTIARWAWWIITVATGAGFWALVLGINVIGLGWSSTLPRIITNNLLLFNGDCQQMKTIDTVSHLVINVLSTLLLGASNYAMQVLSAPTRENIDKAHPEGR